MMIPNWKRVLRKAWSIRLMVLAGFLSGCEVILPMYQESIPRGTFAMLSMLAIGGGFIARIVSQKGMRDE
jgi:hypothetical protein